MALTQSSNGEHALSKFLNTGLDIGKMFAQRKIFGSENATQIQLEQERARWNQLNGAGVINQTRADDGPFGWLDYLYGSPTRRLETGDTVAAQRNPWPVIILGVAVVAIIVWLVRRN